MNYQRARFDEVVESPLEVDRSPIGLDSEAATQDFDLGISDIE
jgi:hypothetical protein